MTYANRVKPEKDPFINFEREQQLRAQILARKEVDRVNFLKQFNENKAKNVLNKALAPRVYSPSPAQKLSAMNPMPMNNQRSASSDPYIQQPAGLPRHLQGDLNKHEGMKEMQYYMKQNMLKNVGLVSPLETMKGKKANEDRLKKAKLIPEEVHIKQLTYMQIREFYYAELLDNELNPIEDPADQKRKEVKNLLMQIGKRKAEEEILKNTIAHPRTIRKEKTVLEDKLEISKIALDHLKEKLKSTLQDAPFSIEEIEQEIVTGTQDRAEKEYLDRAGSEIKNLKSSMQGSRSSGSSSSAATNTDLAGQSGSLGTVSSSLAKQSLYERDISQLRFMQQKGQPQGLYNPQRTLPQQQQRQQIRLQNVTTRPLNNGSIAGSIADSANLTENAGSSYYDDESNIDAQSNYTNNNNNSRLPLQPNQAKEPLRQIGSNPNLQAGALPISSNFLQNYSNNLQNKPYVMNQQPPSQTQNDGTNIAPAKSLYTEAESEDGAYIEYESEMSEAGDPLRLTGNVSRNMVNPPVQPSEMNSGFRRQYTNNANPGNVQRNPPGYGLNVANGQEPNNPSVYNNRNTVNAQGNPPGYGANLANRQVSNNPSMYNTNQQQLNPNRQGPETKNLVNQETKAMPISEEYTESYYSSQGDEEYKSQYTEGNGQSQESFYAQGQKGSGQARNPQNQRPSAVARDISTTYGGMQGGTQQPKPMQGSARQPAASASKVRVEAGKPPRVSQKPKSAGGGRGKDAFDFAGHTDFSELSSDADSVDNGPNDTSNQLGKGSEHPNAQINQPTYNQQIAPNMGAYPNTLQQSPQVTSVQRPNPGALGYYNPLPPNYQPLGFQQQPQQQQVLPPNYQPSSLQPQQQLLQQQQQPQQQTYHAVPQNMQNSSQGAPYIPSNNQPQSLQNLLQPYISERLNNNDGSKHYIDSAVEYSDSPESLPRSYQSIGSPSVQQEQLMPTSHSSILKEHAPTSNKTINLLPVQTKSTQPYQSVIYEDSRDSQLASEYNSQDPKNDAQTNIDVQTPTRSIPNNQNREPASHVIKDSQARSVTPDKRIILSIDSNVVSYDSNLNSSRIAEETDLHTPGLTIFKIDSDKNSTPIKPMGVIKPFNESHEELKSDKVPLISPNYPAYQHTPTEYDNAANEIKLKVRSDPVHSVELAPQTNDQNVSKHLEAHELKKNNREKARLARKYLNLTLIDIRALRNRLGVSTLCDYVDTLRSYQVEEKQEQFRKVVKESLCSSIRGDKFIECLVYILELEDKYYEEQRLKSIKVVEKHYVNVGGKPNEVVKADKNFSNQMEIIYMFLPFWYSKFSDKDNPKSVALLNQFSIDVGIASKIEKVTKLSTIDEFVLFYRNNRSSKQFGIFSDSEIDMFVKLGWRREDVEEFSKTMILLAKEALLTPKILFDFPRLPKTYDVLDLTDMKGLSIGSLSCIVTCIITQETSLNRVIVRNIDLTPDGALLFELLFSSTTTNIIEIDISQNSIRDLGFETILKAFKANKTNYLRILRAGNTSLSAQGGIRVLSFIRETKFNDTFIYLQILSLENNQIGNVGMETIAASLIKNTTLKYLDLSYNNVSDGGINALCSLIKHNQALKVLYIHGNSFSNEYVCKMFIELAAAHDPGLVVLKMGDLNAHVENLIRFISEGFMRLRKLRYVELISSITTYDRQDKITKAVNDLDYMACVVRVMTEDLPRNQKGLIDFISLHILEQTQEEIKQKGNNPELLSRELSTSNKPLDRNSSSLKAGIQKRALPLDLAPPSEKMQKHIQEAADNLYKQHTLEVICYSLEEVAAYNTEFKEGDTYFHRLARLGHLDAVKHVLKRGGDPEIRTAIFHKDFPHATVLYSAIVNGSIEMVKALLMQGAQYNVKDLNNNTPLHYAASMGHVEISELLITHGCVLNVKNKKLMEPVHAALLSDDIKVWEYFMHKLNPQDHYDITKDIMDRRLARGVSPLMLIIENDCVNMFNYFLRIGININHVDEEGMTALHYAVERDLIEYALKLMNFGPRLNTKNSQGETPIVVAVKRGHFDIAQKMADKGAGLDVLTNRGDSLLHFAAKLNHGDMVQWLLSHGLNIELENLLKQKARDVTTQERIKNMMPEKGGILQFNPYMEGNDSQDPAGLRNTRSSVNRRPEDRFSALKSTQDGFNQTPSSRLASRSPLQSRNVTPSRMQRTNNNFSRGDGGGMDNGGNPNESMYSMRTPDRIQQNYRPDQSQQSYYSAQEGTSLPPINQRRASSVARNSRGLEPQSRLMNQSRFNEEDPIYQDDISRADSLNQSYYNNRQGAKRKPSLAESEFFNGR